MKFMGVKLRALKLYQNQTGLGIEFTSQVGGRFSENDFQHWPDMPLD
jgi:hypothetical protein